MKESLKNDVKKLRSEVEKAPTICPHKAPLALIFLESGELRREPEPCAFCQLPRRVEMLFYLGATDEPMRVPKWFAPSLELALESNIKVYGSIDLARV
jgi:hypothetical protein